MRTIQDTLELLLDLGNSRRSHVLELIVIVLIFVEVAMGLWGHR
jgi:uncharacterized Rmd1/YagE family protein